MIIANGLPNKEFAIQKAMFYFCYFLWGFLGMFIIFKNELIIGPFTLKEKVVPLLGILIIIYFLVNIVIAYL
jgi:hypothetical protein